MKCKFNKYIDSYMNNIRSGKIPASIEIHQAMDYIEKKLSDPDVIIKQFGKIARADNFAIHIADMYKQREAKESAPNITKHQSLDGIQYITDTRP